MTPQAPTTGTPSAALGGVGSAQAGEIPQSPALAEARPESISELFSRDPEQYTKQDLARVVEALRAQRARWKEIEAAPKAPRARAKSGFSLDAPAGLKAEDVLDV